MDFPFTQIVNSEDDTVIIAENFLEEIKPGDVIALNGDLGSGKTFFVKAVLNSLGIYEVTSPTFSIVNTYWGENWKINHFDFYRIKKADELFDIGFDEYLFDNTAITFIEWADMFAEVLPQNRFDIKIKYLKNLKREIQIEKKQ